MAIENIDVRRLIYHLNKSYSISHLSNCLSNTVRIA